MSTKGHWNWPAILRAGGYEIVVQLLVPPPDEWPSGATACYRDELGRICWTFD